jgi:hypothetical protein
MRWKQDYCLHHIATHRAFACARRTLVWQDGERPLHPPRIQSCLVLPEVASRPRWTLTPCRSACTWRATGDCAALGVASQREPVPALVKGQLGSSVHAGARRKCCIHLLGRAPRSSAQMRRLGRGKGRYENQGQEIGVPRLLHFGARQVGSVWRAFPQALIRPGLPRWILITLRQVGPTHQEFEVGLSW